MHVSSAFGQGILPLCNSKPHPGCRQHRGCGGRLSTAAQQACRQQAECRGHLSHKLPGTWIAAHLGHMIGRFVIGTPGSLCKLQGSLAIALALPSLSGLASAGCLCWNTTADTDFSMWRCGCPQRQILAPRRQRHLLCQHQPFVACRPATQETIEEHSISIRVTSGRTLTTRSAPCSSHDGALQMALTHAHGRPPEPLTRGVRWPGMFLGAASIWLC